jgi:hypothetical protein
MSMKTLFVLIVAVSTLSIQHSALAAAQVDVDGDDNQVTVTENHYTIHNHYTINRGYEDRVGDGQADWSSRQPVIVFAPPPPYYYGPMPGPFMLRSFGRAPRPYLGGGYFHRF